MSITVSLHNAEEITGQIRSVRDDASPTNWVLVGHFNEDPNVLTLVGSGSGGLAEMKAKMSNAQVQYGLLRVTTQVDLSKTTKFCYIYNLGEKVSFVKKGKFGVVKGQATKHFQPYHVDFEIQSPEEIEEQDVLKKVSEAAGTANKVHDASYAAGKQERGYTTRSAPTTTATLTNQSSSTSVGGSSSPKPVPAATVKPTPGPMACKPTVGKVATQSQGVKIAPNLADALKDIRNDKTSTNWILGSYEGGNIQNQIILVGSGDGGVEQMIPLLKPDEISYGLSRVVDVIDGHPTVKFAFIQFIGANVSMMKKAKIATHKGVNIAQQTKKQYSIQGVQEAFAPCHVDFTISESREISDDIILQKVQSYSGSKSFVK